MQFVSTKTEEEEFRENEIESSDQSKEINAMFSCCVVEL
jgi:hypothetical protein